MSVDLDILVQSDEPGRVLATLLHVHEQTVRRWLRDGNLAGQNFGGKTGWRVREAALREFLDRRPDR